MIVRVVQYNNITKMKKNRKMTILSELISLADQLAKCNTLPLTFDATYQHPHSYRMIAMLSTKGYPISLRHSSVDAVDHLSPSRLDQILSLSTVCQTQWVTTIIANFFFFHIVVHVITFIRNKKVKFQIETNSISSIYSFRWKFF